MARFIFNDEELDATWGLDWLPQLIYWRVLRPNMDYTSGVVGIRTSRTKRLNYQAVREQLEVHGGQGKRQVPKLSDDEIRWAIQSLIKEGVIDRVVGANGRTVPFVFRCLLADTDSSVSQKYTRSTPRGTTDAHHEVQREETAPKTRNNNTSQDFAQGSTADKAEEVQQVNPAKHNAPPEPDIKTSTTTGRVRESALIPEAFCITPEVWAVLYQSGVRLEVAEYFLSEFVNHCLSSGKTSFNWAAEFAVYCKKWGWRYDKERNSSSSGGGDSERGQSRASRAHKRDKRIYADAVASEQGGEDIHQAEGSVRSQVVVPYRGR